jgi:hypothetical protein
MSAGDGERSPPPLATEDRPYDKPAVGHVGTNLDRDLTADAMRTADPPDDDLLSHDFSGNQDEARDNADRS